MNALAIIIVICIVLVGLWWWQQSRKTNGGGPSGSPGGGAGYGGPDLMKITTPVPGRLYGPGATIEFLPDFDSCVVECLRDPSCIGAGFFESLPGGGAGNYSCYKWTSTDGVWRSAPVAAGDVVSQTLSDAIPLSKGSITSPTPGRLVGGSPADITYTSDFSTCAASCTNDCLGAGFYESLPGGGTGNYSCYTYDDMAGVSAVAPVNAGDAYSTSLYPYFGS